MSRLYFLPRFNEYEDSMNLVSLCMANAQYEMQQLCFFKDEHILAGLTRNGQYFQWDVDKRKRIFYNDLAVIPK